MLKQVTQAKESLNKVKSAYSEKVVSEEIQKVAAELRLMSGNDVDTLGLIILNGFRGAGWAQIQISPRMICTPGRGRHQHLALPLSLPKQIGRAHV